MEMEKLIKGLKQCKKAVDISDCDGCPYRKDGGFQCGCVNDLITDALAMAETVSRSGSTGGDKDER